MSDAMPERLIKANIALYKGERGEVLRLVRQYENERPATQDPHHSMVLWLQAQAQTDEEARVQYLYDLIATVPYDDPYAAMSRDYLALEEAYTPAPTANTGLWTRVGGGLALLLLVVVVGTVFLTRGDDPTPTSTQVAIIASPISPTPTPQDRSQPLTAAAFTRRYQSGILQLTALETASERVINLNGDTVTPVTGARFFALELVFECRSGICNNPPEAEIVLITDNDDAIAAREGVRLLAEPQMEPVALGRSTRGWLIFEIPALSRVEQLVIVPAVAADEDPPLIVDLSELGV